MGKKILDSNALYVVLSVILAIALWFYVISLDGTEESVTISGIPVQFVGVEQLEDRDLMIVSEVPKVSVKVKAMPRVLAELNAQTVTATVDVSRIQGASQLDLAYTVTYPSEYAGSVQEVSRNPGSVSVTIANYTEREIPIIGVFNGSPAEGYVAGDADDFQFLPQTLTVMGREDLVNQIYAARVTVGGDKLTESVEGDMPYELIGNNGDVLSLDVECSDELIYTRFPILVTKDVELNLKFTAGGGVEEKHVRCEIEPKAITVSGSEKDVAAIREISLGTVDLAEVRDGDVLTFPIPLANELNNITGVTEAKVTIRLPGFTTKKVFTSNLEVINVPEGWTADIVTAMLEVEVRGTTGALAGITGENVRVVADLEDINQAEGLYTLTAKVYLDNVGSDSGVFGSEYRIVVSLHQ